MLRDNLNESFSQSVCSFYDNEDNNNFVWKFDNNCSNEEILIEYPNILIRRCAFSFINERKTVRWCSPVTMGTTSITADTVNFVISFDKLIYDDDYEYNFKNIVKNGQSINVKGSLILYSGDGSRVYLANLGNNCEDEDNLVITLTDRIGWYDLSFSFNLSEVLCDIEGFDYFADVKGEISSYRKNRCNDQCNKLKNHHNHHNHHHHHHRQASNNKIKINYSSYITITKSTIERCPN